MTCGLHCIVTLCSLYSPKSSSTPCVLLVHLSLYPTPLIFTLSSFLSFLAHHIIGIIQYVVVSDWLLSFSNGHYLLPGVRKVLQALHAGTVAGKRACPDSGASLATLENSLAFPRPWFSHLLNKENININPTNFTMLCKQQFSFLENEGNVLQPKCKVGEWIK